MATWIEFALSVKRMFLTLASTIARHAHYDPLQSADCVMILRIVSQLRC